MFNLRERKLFGELFSRVKKRETYFYDPSNGYIGGHSEVYSGGLIELMKLNDKDISELKKDDVILTWTKNFDSIYNVNRFLVKFICFIDIALQKVLDAFKNIDDYSLKTGLSVNYPDKAGTLGWRKFYEDRFELWNYISVHNWINLCNKAFEKYVLYPSENKQYNFHSLALVANRDFAYNPYNLQLIPLDDIDSKLISVRYDSPDKYSKLKIKT